MKRIVLATGNTHKIKEMRELLAGCGAELVVPSDLSITLEFAEEGRTFAEIAGRKALAYSALSGLPALADDSGLEVDALGGEPGVRSRRFGPSDSDAARIERLLRLMRESGDSARAARFRCAMALASGGALLFEVEGICEGTIAPAQRGAAGFGYDPIFIPRGWDRTFAELGDATKNQISHRALAAQKLRVLIERTDF